MITRFLIVSLCCASFSQGAVTTIFRDVKRHLQMGPTDTEFISGDLDMTVFDGGFTLGQCADDPSFTIVGPYIFCPPGTQGLIAAGDIDGDGIRDDGLFWAVTSVTAANEVEPFRADRVKILAAPPSGIADILRQSDGDLAQVFEVEDTSIIIWWDVLSFPISQYDITRFNADRVYNSGDGELARQYYDLPWGNYLFSYPMLDNPQVDFDDLLQREYGVTHNQTPDVYPGRGHLDAGWIVDGEDDVWVTYDPPIGTFSFNPEDPVDVTGALEVDPKSFFQLEWSGIDTNNTFSIDQMFFSIVGSYPTGNLDPFTGECILDPGEPNQFGIIFPPYSPCTPESNRDEILIGVFDGELDMPPFFFAPGQFVFAHLRFVRNAPAGNQTFDGSQRSIYIPISFVESWSSFALFTAPFSEGGFPFGTPTSERTQTGDFDGDGVSNFYEFALNTTVYDGDPDQEDPEHPDFLTPDFPAIVANETVSQTTGIGECGGELIKRAYLSSLISFKYQFSPNGVNWFTIDEDDPDWTIFTRDSTPEGEELTFEKLDPGDPDGSEQWLLDGAIYSGDVTEQVFVGNDVVLPGAECFFRVVITG